MTSARRPRSERWGATAEEADNISVEPLSPERPVSARRGGAPSAKRRHNSTNSSPTKRSSPSSSAAAAAAAAPSQKQRSMSNPDEANAARAQERIKQNAAVKQSIKIGYNDAIPRSPPTSSKYESPTGKKRSSLSSSTANLTNQLRNLPMTSSASPRPRDARSCDRSITSKQTTTSRRHGTNGSSSSVMRSYKQPLSGNDSMASSLTRTPRGRRSTTSSGNSVTAGSSNRRQSSRSTSTDRFDGDASVVSRTSTYSDARSNGSLRRSRTSNRSNGNGHTSGSSTSRSSSQRRRGNSRDDNGKTSDRDSNESHGNNDNNRSRSRSKNGRSRSSSKSRSKSRSRSKSAKRRSGASSSSGTRRTSAAASVISNASMNDSVADLESVLSQPQPQDTATLTSRSRMRRKSNDRTNLGASLASLDPSARSTGGRSVGGPGLPPARRSVARSNTTTMVKVKRRSKSPERGMVRSKSSDSSVTPNMSNLSKRICGDEPVGLANFLQMAGKKNPVTKSSGRSVTSMPIPKSELSVSGGSVNPKLNRRGKKGEPGRGVARSGSSIGHHGSFTSGLDFLTASASISSKPTKKSKAQLRMGSSLGAGLDFLTAMESEMESASNNNTNAKKKGKRSNKPTRKDEDDREPSLNISDLLGETVELDEEDSSTASTSDLDDIVSVAAMGTIADRRKQFVEELKRTGISESDVFQGDAQEDIFTFYTWSSSRQARPKILRERNLLQDAIQQAAVIETRQRFIKAK